MSLLNRLGISTDYPYTDKVLNYVLIAVLVWAVITVLWLVVNYIIRSRTLYAIGKRRGVKGSGMAWIPLFYVWTLGGIAEKFDSGHGIKRRWKLVMLLLGIISVAGYLAPLLYPYDPGSLAVDGTKQVVISESAMIEIVNAVLAVYAILIPTAFFSATFNASVLICTYKLFESCRPRSALKYLVISILVPYAAPFCLRACLSWDDGVKLETQKQPDEQYQSASFTDI